MYGSKELVKLFEKMGVTELIVPTVGVTMPLSDIERLFEFGSFTKGQKFCVRVQRCGEGLDNCRPLVVNKDFSSSVDCGNIIIFLHGRQLVYRIDSIVKENDGLYIEFYDDTSDIDFGGVNRLKLDDFGKLVLMCN